MDIPIAERRQIENEMIFRRGNEKIGIGLDALDALHIADGNPALVWDDDRIIEFRCECSDENCEVRIPLYLSAYKKIHLDRNAFTIQLNHQVNLIETVTITEKDYAVVVKNNSTSDPGSMLNNTTIDNSGNN